MSTAYASELVARLRRVLSLTAWERTLDGIAPDGSYTPRLALQAFALAYGRLPGVRTPSGPAGRAVDGTAAMQMVAQVWTRLSAAQHGAIDRYLHAPHDASSPRVARDAAAPAVFTPSPQFQAMADRYNAIYRAKLPNAPPVTVKVFTVNVPQGKNGSDLMNALPVNARGEFGGGPPAYCRILVTPLGASRTDLERQMAHEMFHCYTYVLDPNWPSLGRLHRGGDG